MAREAIGKMHVYMVVEYERASGGGLSRYWVIVLEKS